MDTVEKTVDVIMEGKLVKLEVVCKNDDEVRILKDSLRKMSPQVVIERGSINEIIQRDNTIRVATQITVVTPLPWVRTNLLNALRSKSSTVVYI